MKLNWMNAAKPALRIEKEFYPGCFSCGEIIRHPLCPHCISQGVLHWAGRYDKLHDSLVKGLDSFLHDPPFSLIIHTRCVACNLTRVSICPGCFTAHIYTLLRETGVGVRALSEFLFMFNFDFSHTRYFHDLEALGGY